MVTLSTAILSGLLSIALPLGEPVADQSPTPPVTSATPTSPPVAAEGSDERMSEADRWMVYQYILGGAENAPMMLRAIVDQIDDPDNREETWPLLSVYAAALGTRNKEHLDHWIQQAVTMSDEFKMLFAYAVWYADYPKAAERLHPLLESFPEDHVIRKRIESMLGHQPPDFATLPVHSPAALDYLWACFLATGDTRFVDRIMTVLPPKDQTLDDPEFGDINEILLAGSARWSLISNAFQHPKVLEHLKTRRAGEPDPWPELDQIIQGAMDQLAERPCPAPTKSDGATDEQRAAPAPQPGKDQP